MRNIINKILKNKKTILIASVLFFGVLSVISIAQAATTDTMPGVFAEGISFAVIVLLGWIFTFIFWILGLITTLIISVLIQIAQYSHFIDVQAVTTGWVMVRDLCNMFFVLILLVIAFATILRVESYNVKKLLPKLIIMAVLINFSKTICGLIIDFSQVIMLTFVSGFADKGEANLVTVLQIDQYSSLGGKFQSAQAMGAWNTVGSMLAALFALIISLIVLIVFVAILVMRLVMIWIYVILSPLAFLMAAFPEGQKYSSQWWSEFTKNVITGPVLAFFLWLALLTANKSGQDIISYNTDTAKVVGSGAGSQELCSGLTSLFCSTNFQTYIITIGLLIGGLMITQQIGGIAGSIAGKGMQWAKQAPLGMGKLAGKGIWKGAKSYGEYKLEKFGAKHGVDLNPVRVWEGIKEQKAQNKAKRLEKMQQKAREVVEETGGTFHSIAALTGMPRDGWDRIMSKEGRRQTLMGGARMQKKRDELQPELDQAKFKMQYITSDEEKRNEISSGIIDKTIDLEEEISKKTVEKENAAPEDAKKLETEIAKLQNDLDNSRIKQDFITNEAPYIIDDKEKRKEVISDYNTKQKGYQKYVPSYAFESRAAEEKAVDEEMSKFNKIDDAQELVRILYDEIKEGKKADKSRIKGLIKKLTKDYNENEFLLPMVGDTSYAGLQKMMDELYTEGSKHYAGFTEQESYALGAQVAEMCKKTSHWETAASFIMENGKWRKATEKEHVQIASTEFGKKGPQANMRESNRLATGKHYIDQETGETKWVLQPTGVIMLQSFDNERMIGRLSENMTESMAKYFAPYVDNLAKQGKISQALADKVKIKSGEAVDFDGQYGGIKGSMDAVVKNPKSFKDIAAEARVLKAAEEEAAKKKAGSKTETKTEGGKGKETEGKI